MDLKFIRESIIGNHTLIPTPYGERLLTYADYTASGRTLHFIENYLLEIEKYYGNTHTNDSYTGKTMNLYYEEAEAIIKRCLHLTDDYFLFPTGTGTTGAIIKLLQILGLYLTPALKYNLERLCSNERGYHEDFSNLIQEVNTERPVVFVSPYEHHSNYLIWKESFAEVVEIAMKKDGSMDLMDLESKLKDPKYSHRIKLGSFSAASNITGIITDMDRVSELMHLHGGFVFFDYAASAPYVDIKMVKDELIYYDAIFLSPHKFIGGPGSCGLLIIHKDLYNTIYPPTVAGGGTVHYVSPYFYEYEADVETRENAGTPGILQLLRAALAIELKHLVTPERIEWIEQNYLTHALQRLLTHPNFILLGPKEPKNRLGIISFNIRHHDRILHPKFVAKLLNDLFGIQTRAGCACAGPYGHRLLGIDHSHAELINQALKEGMEILRPGFVRLNFHYTMDSAEVNFIVNAIIFIAHYGYLFLQDYRCDPRSGSWTHINDHNLPVQEPFGLSSCLNQQKNPPQPTVNRSSLYHSYMNEAYKLLNRYLSRLPYGVFKQQRFEQLRWFPFIHMKKHTDQINE